MTNNAFHSKFFGMQAAQILAIIMGDPGTGKSQVLRALQWYALQIDAVEMLAAVAYTWRAALPLGTIDNPACSTSTFFAIDSFNNNGLRRAGASWQAALARLQDKRLRIVFIDEFSFVSQEHMAAIDKRLRQVRGDDRPFGGLHVVLVGDPNQHAPPGGHALYFGASGPREPQLPQTGKRKRAGNDTTKACQSSPGNDDEADEITTPPTLESTAGREAFLAFNQVYFLREQQRMRDTEGTNTLLDYSTMFMSTTRVPRSRVEQWADAINAKAITDIKAILPLNPKVVTLRQVARSPISRRLALLRAAHMGKRACIYFAQHVGNTGVLPEVVQQAVRRLNPKSFKYMPGALVFFEVNHFIHTPNHLPLRQWQPNKYTFKLKPHNARNR